MALADSNPKPEMFVGEWDKEKIIRYYTKKNPYMGDMYREYFDAMDVSKKHLPKDIIYVETEEYLKSIGHWDAFERVGAERDLQGALETRYADYNIYYPKGQEVFDKIAGIYEIPLQKRANQHSLHFPQSVKCSLDKKIHEYNISLLKRFEEEKQRAPPEAKRYFKTVPNIYLKDGDNDYIWTITKTGEDGEGVR